jgi:hypothetical protein
MLNYIGVQIMIRYTKFYDFDIAINGMISKCDALFINLNFELN